MNQQWLNSIWRRTILVFVVLMVAVVSSPLRVEAVSQGGIIAQINSQRAASGLPPLAANGLLNTSAQIKAQDMATKGYFAHTAPDGTTAGSLIRSVGYGYTTMGENLAQGFTSDSGVVATWMGSPGHRANILSGAFRDVGIGVVGGIVVAHFGATTSAPAPAPAPVAPPAPKPAPVASPKPAGSVAQQSAPSTAASPDVAPAPQAPVVEAVKESPKQPSPTELLIADLVKFIEYQEPKLVTSE